MTDLFQAWRVLVPGPKMAHLPRFCASSMVAALIFSITGCGGDDEESLPPDDLGLVSESSSRQFSATPPFADALGFETVLIRAGQFTMGSPETEDGRADDEAEHLVELTQDFFIMTTEVTQERWELVMDDNPSAISQADHPVEGVTWHQAVDFANRLSVTAGYRPAYVVEGEEVTWADAANGYRLPTEAEWEYVARTGESTVEGSGDPSLPSATRPVGTGTSNSWGLFDLDGNVGEWCWDWYGPYSQDKALDPVGGEGPGERVVRGMPSTPGTARRHPRPPGEGKGVGLRLARFESSPDSSAAPMSDAARQLAHERCVGLFESALECVPEGPAMFIEEMAVAVESIYSSGDALRRFGDHLQAKGKDAMIDSLIQHYTEEAESSTLIIQGRCRKFVDWELGSVTLAESATEDSLPSPLEGAEACFGLPCDERIPCLRPYFSANLAR